MTGLRRQWLVKLLFTAGLRSKSGKVMFSQASICPGGGGAVYDQRVCDLGCVCV